jgi:hypothetical protein
LCKKCAKAESPTYLMVLIDNILLENLLLALFEEENFVGKFLLFSHIANDDL